MNGLIESSLAVLGAIGALALVAYVAIIRSEKKERASIENDINVREMLAAQDEIKRLVEESTRDTTDYKTKREAYNAKWRTKSNVTLIGTSHDDSGKG